MKNYIRGHIPHVKSKRKKKPACRNILSHVQKSTASNIDLEIIEETVSGLVTKKIIDKVFRILNESCDFFTLPQILTLLSLIQSKQI